MEKLKKTKIWIPHKVEAYLIMRYWKKKLLAGKKKSYIFTNNHDNKKKNIMNLDCLITERKKTQEETKTQRE